VSLLLLLDNDAPSEETQQSADNIAVTDVAKILASLNLSDPITGTDPAVKLAVTVDLSDVVSLLEDHVKLLAALDLLDAVSVSDLAARVANADVVASDDVGISDFDPDRSVGVDLRDGTDVSDVKGPARIGASLLDVVALLEDHVRRLVAIGAGDDITGADSIGAPRIGVPGLVDTVAAVDEQVKRLVGLDVDDSISVEGGLRRLVGLLAKDLLDITESRKFLAGLGITDGTTLDDYIIGRYLKQVFDQVGISDQPSILAGLMLRDAISVEETRSLHVQRLMLDLVETAVGKKINVGISLADPVNVSERMLRSVELLITSAIAATDLVDGDTGESGDTASVIAIQERLRIALGIIRRDLVTVRGAQRRGLGIGLVNETTASETLSRLVGLSILDSLTTTERTLRAIGLVTRDSVFIGEEFYSPTGAQSLDSLSIADALRIAVGLAVASQVEVISIVGRQATGALSELGFDNIAIADRLITHVGALLRDGLSIDSKLQPRYHIPLFDRVSGSDVTRRGVSLMAVDSLQVIDQAYRSVGVRLSELTASTDSLLIHPGLRLRDGIDIADFFNLDSGTQLEVLIADSIGLMDPSKRALGALLQDDISVDLRTLSLKRVLQSVFDEVSITDIATRARIESVLLTDLVSSQEQVSRAVDLLVKDTTQVFDLLVSSVDINAVYSFLEFTGEVLRSTGFRDESLRVTKLAGEVLRSTGLTKEKFRKG
jgi:hypothetical protein